MSPIIVKVHVVEVYADTASGIVFKLRDFYCYKSPGWPCRCLHLTRCGKLRGAAYVFRSGRVRLSCEMYFRKQYPEM
jgi:hypothetical protein